MKNIKKIIGSLLLATAFAATSVGTTFALFTDEAKTTINVSSGRVDVNQSVSILSVKELYGNDVVEVAGKYTSQAGSLTYLDSSNPSLLHLEKWVPGDKVTLRIVNTNNSTVNIKTRFLESHASTSDPDLYDALDVSYVVKDAEDHDISYKFMEWNLIEPTVTTISTVDVTIEFVNHGEEITSNEEGIDNAYQNTNCTIAFTQQAVQGNANAKSLLEELNDSLSSAALTSGSNKTLSEALDDVSVTPNVIQNAGFVWNVLEDQFYYPQEATTNMHNFFKIYSEEPLTKTYSIYAYGWNNVGVIDLDGVGFDAGNSTGITNINYVNTSGSGKTVTINTNGSGTTLTIDAATDVVHHYGVLGVLSIVAVLGESYHEFGRVGFVQVSKGRVALEEGAKVTQVHFDYNESEEKFEEIIIAYDESVELPKFSRDEVDNIATGGTLVVELQNSTVKEEADSSFVWLYQQGLKEQIRVSESKESAGEVTATDETVSEEVAEVATQIANNLKEGASYTEEEIAAGQVDLEDITNGGLDEEAKEEATTASVDEVIIEEVEEEYPIRIGKVGYNTLEAAVEDAVDNDVIYFSQDFENRVKITYSKDLIIDLGNNTLTYTGNKNQTMGSNHSLTYRNGNLVFNTYFFVQASSSMTFDHMNVRKTNVGAQLFQHYSNANISITFRNSVLVNRIATPSSNAQNSALSTQINKDNVRYSFEKTTFDWNSEIPFAQIGNNSTSYEWNTNISFDSESYESFMANDLTILAGKSGAMAKPILNENGCVYALKEARLWTEVVTSKPASYIEEENNISISDAEGLAYVAYLSREDSFAGKTITLTNDIDVGEWIWEPIRSIANASFAGTLDGNGHTISNLFSTYGTVYGKGTYGSGLFHRISGTVRNLVINRANIDPNNDNNINGAVAGYSAGATFDNITVKNSVIEGYGKVGALMGMAESGTTIAENIYIENTKVRGTYNLAYIAGLAVSEISLNNCQIKTSLIDDLPSAENQTFVLNDVACEEEECESGDHISGTYWSDYDSDDQVTYLYSKIADLYNTHQSEHHHKVTIAGDVYYIQCSEYPVNAPRSENGILYSE